LSASAELLVNVVKAQICPRAMWDFTVVHGSNFGQLPFLLPPMTHVCASSNWTQVCSLTTGRRRQLSLEF